MHHNRNMEKDSSVSTPPARILIVDDHPNTANMLARVLAKFDTPVEVLTASTGEDALRQISDRLVDVLITDFLMPGMSGLDLIERLKGGREPVHTILMTAYDTPGLAISARRLNIQTYLVKPVQPEKIRDIVAGVLRQIRPTVVTSTSAALPVKGDKILIVDDYPDNVRLLAVRLQSEGFIPISASDGEMALEKVRDEQPALVLLDANMPKKDGFQVLAEIRGDPLIAHTPVIVLTAARASRQDIRDGLALGADDYVTKPFDWRELLERIRGKLRARKTENELRLRNRELVQGLVSLKQLLPALRQFDRETDLLVEVPALIQGALGYPVVALWQMAGAGEELGRTLILHSAAGPESELAQLGYAYGPQQAAESGRPCMFPVAAAKTAELPGSPPAGVAVPVECRGQVVAILSIHRALPAPFDSADQTMLEILAAQAGVALESITTVLR